MTQGAAPLPREETLSVSIIGRAELGAHPVWTAMFADDRKDHRYYEIIEDTLPDYDHRYFAFADTTGRVRAIQPFFLVDQDILEGVGSDWRPVVAVRGRFPRFLKLRTLMVGCSAGEGHLATAEGVSAAAVAQALADSLVAHARALGAHLVVMKEFPAHYREAFGCFQRAGFVRSPSMPMTKLNIQYDGFDHFLDKALSGKARRNVRRNLKASAGADLRMEITDITDGLVDELFPLYLNVFNRSAFHFEKLTKAYFLGLGARMPDKIRMFTWRLGGRLVAFNICMVEGDEFFSEYIGFDYAVALDLHLYFVVVRDTIEWAIRQGYRWFRSSGLNYDPKLHLRHQLDPIDLYVRHVSPLANVVMKRVVPRMTPARYDPILKQFANYDEIW